VNALRATRVLDRKFVLERRGSRKDLAHVPAVVTEVSCPSFAKMFLDEVGLEGGGRCTHVGSDEHPLRERVGVQVIIEHCEVLDFGQAVRLGGHGFVADERTVSLNQ
jgi:hypothetical protein